MSLHFRLLINKIDHIYTIFQFSELEVNYSQTNLTAGLSYLAQGRCSTLHKGILLISC